MERRLAAIMAADVVGYSRLMGANEVGTLTALKEIRTKIVDVAISNASGRVFKMVGDGVLAEFGSIVGALSAALAIQQAMKTWNASLPADRQILLRIGVNIGDVVIEDGDVFGDGVNIASRIEALAPPGGIAVSGAARDQVGNRLDVVFQSVGQPELKNIDRSIEVFHVRHGVIEGETEFTEDTNRPSIAVLPFSNMSGDPDQEYFADGITEDLITDLSNLAGVYVVSRNSAFVYKNRAVNLQEVARELGVRHILEGSVRKAGQRVRITGQLIDGVTEGHIWAERFDRDLSDIFDLQDEITRIIVEQLSVRLLDTELKKDIRTASAEAYACYLRGKQLHYEPSRRNFEQARTAFLEALGHDPDYARAYIGLAQTETRLNEWFGASFPTDEIARMAKRALELAPDQAEAHVANAVSQQALGNLQEADDEFQLALRLDPLCYDAHYNFARFLFTAKRFDTCAHHFVRSLEIKPDDYRSPLLLVSIFLEIDRRQDCERYLRLGLKRAERASQANPDNPDPLELGATTLAKIGHHDEAREWLERALESDPNRAVTNGYNNTCTYALIGELETALDWLEQFADRFGQSHRDWMRSDSSMHPLRHHPRFIHMFDSSEEAGNA